METGPPWPAPALDKSSPPNERAEGSAPSASDAWPRRRRGTPTPTVVFLLPALLSLAAWAAVVIREFALPGHLPVPSDRLGWSYLISGGALGTLITLAMRARGDGRGIYLRFSVFFTLWTAPLGLSFLAKWHHEWQRAG